MGEEYKEKKGKVLGGGVCPEYESVCRLEPGTRDSLNFLQPKLG